VLIIVDGGWNGKQTMGSERVEELYLAEQDDMIYVRAVGHITANSCKELKDKVVDRLTHEPRVKDLIVDLSSCDYMDSTFMGVLIGFNKRIREIAGHPLELLKPTQACRTLLANLGVLRLLTILDGDVAVPHEMARIGKSSEAELDTLIAAHDNLIELNEANRAKFELLRKILADQKKKSGN
jgi:anti-anti-sigma factor